MFQQQPTAVDSPSDEMSLRELGQMLYVGWRLILGALLIAWLLAGIYLARTPNQYEATLIVNVGQIGVVTAQTTQVGMRITRNLIENETYSVIRMKGTKFKNAVVQSLGWSDNEKIRLFQKSYQASSPENGQLKVGVHGLTQDDAKQAVEACLAVLVDIHNGLQEQVVAQKGRELSKVESDIADSESFLRNIDRLGQRRVQSSSEPVTANWLKVIKEEKSRLRDLYLQQIVLKEAMDPELNMPTMAAEPTIVSGNPVFPKERSVWLFATVAGFFLGMLLVTWRSLRRMNRATVSPTSADQ